MDFRAMLFVVFCALLVGFSECLAEESSASVRDYRVQGDAPHEVEPNPEKLQSLPAVRAVACREFADVTSTDSLAHEVAAFISSDSLDYSHLRDSLKTTDKNLARSQNVGTEPRPLCRDVFLQNIGKHASSVVTHAETLATQGAVVPPTSGRDGIVLRQGRHDDSVGVTGSHADGDSGLSGLSDKKFRNMQEEGIKLDLGVLGSTAIRYHLYRVILPLRHYRGRQKPRNVLARKRRDVTRGNGVLSSVSVRPSPSLRDRLVSRACCRGGRHFGGNPGVTNCSAVSGRFVSGNIVVLTDLRERCVQEFVLCCQARQNELQTSHKHSQSGPESETVNNHSEEEDEIETPLPEPPSEPNTTLTIESEVRLSQACCLNGRKTAYNLAKRCQEERDVYINKTARGAVQHTPAALAGCRMEFGRCCDAQRDVLRSAGLSRLSPGGGLASLRGLRLKQHCCRQGSIQGLAPETNCAGSAREFVWKPLKSSAGRRAQCSAEFSHCCALRQKQNRKVEAVSIARKHRYQRVSPTLVTPAPIIRTDKASPDRSREGSVAKTGRDAHRGISNTDSRASTAKDNQDLAKERGPVSSRRRSREDGGKSPRARRRHAEKLGRIGNQDQVDDTAVDSSVDIKAVKSSSRPERSKKSTKTAKSSPNTERKGTGRRNRVAGPSPLQSDGPVPPADDPGSLVAHRRALRLCCLHGNRVDPNVVQPRSCSREGESYARGTSLAGPAHSACQELFVRCCEAGNETHPGHGGPVREPGKKVRRYIKNRRRKWARMFHNSKSLRATG